MKGKSSGSSGSEPTSFRKPKNKYADLDESMTTIGEGEYEMGATVPARSIRTYVHAEGPKEVEEDGIHLQYHFQQKVAVDEMGRM